MNLAQKLVEVRKCIPYLQKENKGHQYSYVSSSQALGAIRSKLDEMGILLIPSAGEIQVDTSGKQIFTHGPVYYTWHDAESGEVLGPFAWYAQGMDSGEKGIGKLYTYAEKYWILKFFQVPTDKDDPDSFQEKTDKPVPALKKARPSKEPAPPKKKAAAAGPELASADQKATIKALASAPMAPEKMKDALSSALDNAELTLEKAASIISLAERRLIEASREALKDE